MKWILTLFVIAGALGALWYLTSGDKHGEGLDTQPQMESIGPGGVTNVAETVPLDGDLQGTNGNQGPREVVSGNGTAQNSDGTLAAPNTSKLSVQPLRSGSTQPMSDVTVWMLDRTQRSAVEWQAAHENADGWRAYIKKHGVQAVTDVNGFAIFPECNNVAVYAEGQGHTGESELIGPLSTPLTVQMRPKIDLQVIVADADGHPGVSVPVAVYVEDLAGPKSVITRFTMANGIVQFRQLSGMLSAHGSERKFSVGLAFPTRRMTMIPFDALNLPTEPLRLELPPTAPVTVHVLDGNGERMVERMTVAVGMHVMDQATARRIFRAFDTRRTSNGETRLPYVEVGADLNLRLSGVRTLSELEVTKPGPRVKDQVETIEVVWDLALPTIHGLATDGSGTPLGGRRGRFRMNQNGVSMSGPGFVCDSEGQFEIIVTQPWEPGSERLALIELFATASEGPLQGSMDLSFDVPPGITDYGRVSFSAMPLLAAGTVIGPGGEAVASAHVRLDAGKGGEGGELVWNPLPGLSASTKEEGAFEIYGRDPQLTLRLVVRRRGFLEATLPFEVGAQGLTVQLVEGELPGESKGDISDEGTGGTKQLSPVGPGRGGY